MTGGCLVESLSPVEICYISVVVFDFLFWSPEMQQLKVFPLGVHCIRSPVLEMPTRKAMGREVQGSACQLPAVYSAEVFCGVFL